MTPLDRVVLVVMILAAGTLLFSLLALAADLYDKFWPYKCPRCGTRGKASWCMHCGWPGEGTTEDQL